MLDHVLTVRVLQFQPLSDNMSFVLESFLLKSQIQASLITDMG